MEQPTPDLVSMQPGDALVLRLLGQTPGVGKEKAELVAEWWRQQRDNAEAVAAFLVRMEVFTTDAIKTVEMARKGYVQFADCLSLLQTEGLARIDAHCSKLSKQTHADIGVTTRPAGASTMPPSVPNLPASAREETPTLYIPKEEEQVSQTLMPTQLVASPTKGRKTRSVNSLQPGMVIGKCLITEHLGKGSTGTVYRAVHQTLGITVAVKILQKALLDQDPELREQLRREARLLAQLNHPNLIRVWDCDDNGDLPYVVLECVEGLSLAELIEQSGRLRPDRALRFITQVADGLSAAHKIGIVHRDVKPANILIAKDGSAKLADLGLALVCDETLRANTSSQPENPGLAGTAAFMAPEQIREAARVDQRSDIYALGATAYHAMTGQMPFRGRSSAEVMIKHLREEPVHPHEVEPNISPLISQIILKMMAKSVSDRFQTCEEVVAALTAAAATAAGAAGLDGFGRSTGTESEASPAKQSFWQRMLSGFTRGSGNEPKESP